MGVARFVSLPYCYLVPCGCWCCCAMAGTLETCLQCCYQPFPWYSHYHNPWEGARFLRVDAATAPHTICQAVWYGGHPSTLLPLPPLLGIWAQEQEPESQGWGSIPVLPPPLILPPLYMLVYPLSDVNV